MFRKFGILFFVFLPLVQFAQSNDDCLACHSDSELTMERNGREVSLFVDEDKFLSSIHGEAAECIDCHVDFDPEELPHKSGENIAQVDCASCHDTEDFLSSIHGQKKIQCFSCHTRHEILPAAEFEKKAPETCVTCHKNAKVKNYEKSVHFEAYKSGNGGPTCLTCHAGNAHKIQKADFKAAELHAVCGQCHEKQVKGFEGSLHGNALKKGVQLAPDCITCHSSHEIRRHTDPKAKIYVTNIPYLCGDCHKDGTNISELESISQRHILENYAESIHGDGLLRRGLKVTAVCTSCHFSHNILPHENPNSSINRNNIAATCMQCHSLIEEVHTKVINGELWEKEPHKIPACVECHQPHTIRKVFYQESFADQMCMKCHGDKNLKKVENGKTISLYIDLEKFEHSAHKDNSCIKCHVNVSMDKNPVCLNSGKVDCSTCHAEYVDDYKISTHGTEFAAGNPEAPYCTDCHGKHDILKKDNPQSLTNRHQIPNLCAKCHEHGKQAKRNEEGLDVVQRYQMGIHGKGLFKSGLTVTAVCVDCHTSHRELPASDPISSVNPNNTPETCGKCHAGIYDEFKTSIHSTLVTKTDKKLPTCADCHSSHSILRPEESTFRSEIYNQCGSCHEEVTETYFETFHGKVTKLGSVGAAKCHDCHGAHNILPPSDPASTLSRSNIVQTCQKCHENSNKKFVGYLTHATHHDKDKYPILFYTFWGMSILLMGTFTFFGLHTLLWLPRAMQERKRLKRKHSERKTESENNGK